jgi:pilus assembly protein CpaF
MPLGAKPPQPLNWINAPGRVFMFRHGRSELTTTTLDEGQVRDLVEKMPKAAGRRVDLSTPFVEANLLTSPMGA